MEDDLRELTYSLKKSLKTRMTASVIKQDPNDTKTAIYSGKTRPANCRGKPPFQVTKTTTLKQQLKGEK